MNTDDKEIRLIATDSGRNIAQFPQRSSGRVRGMGMRTP